MAFTGDELLGETRTSRGNLIKTNKCRWEEAILMVTAFWDVTTCSLVVSVSRDTAASIYFQ
jgi:hypothetical protein